MRALKTKQCLPLWVNGSFKRFNEEKLPDKEYFCRSVKDEKTSENGKKIRGPHNWWRIFDVQKNLERL